MAKIIVTAEVENAVNWEDGFRTHGDLFRDQTVQAIDFNVTSENEVAIVFECKDRDKFLALLDTPATEEAMKFDGVKRDTVKMFVLDKEFRP
jgi:hypothetical protein